MGSTERPFFDLNEIPEEEELETASIFPIQPRRAAPSTITRVPDLFPTPPPLSRIINNNAFSHASAVSGFQPFVRSKDEKGSLVSSQQINSVNEPSSSKKSIEENIQVGSQVDLNGIEAKEVEKEEGEWSDVEGSSDAQGTFSKHKVSVSQEDKELQEKKNMEPETGSENNESSSDPVIALELEKTDRINSSQISETSDKVEASMDREEEKGKTIKQKEVKGVEASYALKVANNPGKRSRIDHEKEAMLGKKRNRRTMFLNLDDVKQASSLKAPTPRKQNFPPPVTTRTVKEACNIPIPSAEKQINEDSKQVDLSSNEGNNCVESDENKSESNGDVDPGLLGRPRKLNSAESSQLKNPQMSTRKSALVSQSSAEKKLGNKKLPLKKSTTVSYPYQDTSVERLLREVTNEKLFHRSGGSDLECVPGQFESMEDYVKVFEPLLFEECRAQLYSTWEELSETVSRDSHIMVRIKSVERRERGWYDAIVLPASEYKQKWTFKEGEVAVLSNPRPGTVRPKNTDSSFANDGDERDLSGRVAGTVRRYMPVDTRDPPGAVLHFYVGEYDSNSNGDDDHILRKLQPRGIWFLTTLGTLATTQREYIALHAFRRLNLQMQTAILQPSPEHFPKYEEPPPAMPECFTPNFTDHLRRSFNGPQLGAIQWAAMHTAAGTNNGTSKKQDPWPFTLVQGPPGTGKTHTVWGMLNVIHLVQYQHYYNALLKKLAPDSYKKNSENSRESVPMGSIDEVLQNMDQNLFRTLPKLCPKPRMLVCAPSNAATDELLSRVLDRGFIDGEMKVYRPDVARVGVDTQTRGAQAVSVERRTEQLLVKSREEVHGWMQQLRGHEAHLSQQMVSLQRELNTAAISCRSQGSVGVDPDVLMARDQSRDTLLQSLAAVVENRDKVLVEMSRLCILEQKFRAGGKFNLEEARADLEASFANEAEIVFTTVSSSGRRLFSRLTHGFDMVVIDEAAQASEVGILPPLALGAARCVLVGDPQQLPATVISRAAGTLLYSRSLFERFQQAGCPTMLLSVQYRMHPQIRDFPSRYFYQGRLTDSESVANSPDEAYFKDPLLRPYVFYNISHGRESQRGGSVSYQNVQEAQFCFRLYEHLQKTLKSSGAGKVTVGIITPYKLQLKCLQREFEEVLKSDEGKEIYINTVDAFQGQERDVIIMSCVRASSHGVGFVSDIRRMNVALTRAKKALWVMGNASSLVKSDDWAALIMDAKERNCYTDMDSLPKDFLPPRAPTSTHMHGKGYSNFRAPRSGGRHRAYDRHRESRSGTPSEDDEKQNSSSGSRSGNYRHSKSPMETSSRDNNRSVDEIRDTRQNGVQRKQNSAGVAGKSDL